MDEHKNEAMEVANRLHQENRIDYGDYSALMDGLGEIETLRDRDEALEEMWAQFADVPMNPETECIEERFMGWEPGAHREEIWHWFDRRHSKGVGYLLYGEDISRVPKGAKFLHLNRLCICCESLDCLFNHDGECRFALVHERKPNINEVDGCIDYDYKEGEC